MKNYLIQITFETPYSTPMQADTIFGSLCWAIRYKDGEKALEEFLLDFNKNPLLVSNGFPKGMLPRPVSTPVTREEAKEIIDQKIGSSKKNLALGIKCFKKLKKRLFVSKSLFIELRKSYSEKILINNWMTPEFIESVEKPKERKEPYKEETIAHNSINRLTTKPMEEGGLFFTEATFFNRKKKTNDGCFDLYLSTGSLDIETLDSYFKLIAATGFGKDASTGKGYFKFKIQENNNDLFSFRGNSIMTLSNGTLSSEIMEPCYKTLTKYGKLGGHWAMDETNPFKKPILMVQAGSTFKAKSRKSFYSGLLSNVHSHKEGVRHYGCLYPVMFNMEE